MASATDNPSQDPTDSYAEIVAAVTAPGERFETTTATIGGVEQVVFKNAPPSMRELWASTRARGDEIFLVYEDERWSFAAFMAKVDALAATLVDRYGVVLGDRVAIGMRNYPEWVVSHAAITSIGAVSVSLNAWWTEDELDFALGDCGAKVLMADRERAERANATCQRLGIATIVVRADGLDLPGVDHYADVVVDGAPMPEVVVSPTDDATILYTSGTTGRPKGAVSTHSAVIQALMAFACRAAVDRVRRPEESDLSGNDPAFILIVPLFHVTGGVAVLLSCVASGAKLVMMYKWDPERALELIEREKVTNFVGVPTQSWDLLESPRFAEFDTSSLNSVGGGGAPAPPELVKRVGSSFKKGKPSIGYGMTETNAYGPGNNGIDYLSHPTSAGRTVPVMQVEIRDADDQPVPVGSPGEIWFKGPNLIRGYWNRPDATAETIVDGWLRTGDLGRLDADGFVYVEDRAKDMILRAGENVYCAEVEAAIYEHPSVHEAAVFGTPHERLGEEVATAIFLKPGTTLTPEELAGHVATRLAAFKVPTKVIIVDAPLPRNPAGKILKRQLRDELTA